MFYHCTKRNIPQLLFCSSKGVDRFHCHAIKRKKLKPTNGKSEEIVMYVIEGNIGKMWVLGWKRASRAQPNNDLTLITASLSHIKAYQKCNQQPSNRVTQELERPV